MAYDFPWSELDTEMDALLVSEDTGLAVRRWLSACLYDAFLAEYADSVRVEIWGPDSLINAFAIRSDDWLGTAFNNATFLKAKLEFGFGTRQEVIVTS